jgi:ATP-dependent RNA helicase RhlE
MKFEEYRIAPEIKANLAEKEFKRPTDIQFKTIPHVLGGEDVLAIAQTGTGKTAAFAIPIIHLLMERGGRRKDGVRCLVMAPTHELALQITAVFESLTKNTGITAFALIGGVDQDPQIKQLQLGVDVLVATPGRIFDMVNQQHLNLSNAGILVLDEADHMLDLGFYKDITDLIRFLPSKRQTLYFSATINQKIKKLAYSLVHNPIRIQISPKNPVAKNVIHRVAFIGMDDKRFFLERMVGENPESKILVFVRTKVRAERVLKAMGRVSIKAVTIHTGKNQDEREEAMRLFVSGEIKIMIATDVSARGIDIENVEFVVNYDLPDKPENYVHRVGRTGRGNHKGHAFSYCSDEEKELLAEIEEFLGDPIEELRITKGDYTETIDYSDDANDDWKTLLKKAEIDNLEYLKKKKKRNKKKS